MDLNGRCGGEAPGRLPLLVGEPVDVCPVALALAEPEAAQLAQALPSAWGSGDLAGGPRSAIPPRYRAALGLAERWLSEWKSQCATRSDEP